MSVKFTLSLTILVLFQTVAFGQLDYSDLDHWLIHPEKPFSLLNNYSLDLAVVNPALEVDSIISITNNATTDTGIDIFWVHPTYGGSVTQVQTTPLTALPPAILSRIAAAQGGLLAKYGRFYAPRYRQASPLTFFLQNQDSLQAATLAEAYADVKAAFLHYLEHQSGGNRFILAGHSQGSYMLSFLIRDLIDDDPALRSRMVLAALGGMAFYYAPPGQFVGGLYQKVPLCTALEAENCVVMWRSYKAGQELPEAGFAVPARNPWVAARNMVYRQLDLAQDYAYADSLSFGLEPTALENYVLPVAANSDLAPPGIRFVAFNDMYEAYFERRGPFSHGLMVDYVGRADDQRENDLATLEQGPQWELAGYHQKDYNVFIWALLRQIDCKLGNCQTLTKLESTSARAGRIRLFPNPSRQFLRLEATKTIASVSVFDGAGQVVLSIPSFRGEPLDLSGQAAGLYLIRISDTAGVVSTHKVIITP